MAQHDYVIDNGPGSAVRADINAALQALISDNAGTVEPTVTYAWQNWLDTSVNPAVLKQRKGDNSGWQTPPGAFIDAPTDSKLYGRSNGAWIDVGANFMPLTGGVMTGFLSVNAANVAQNPQAGTVISNSLSAQSWGLNAFVNAAGSAWVTRVAGYSQMFNLTPSDGILTISSGANAAANAGITWSPVFEIRPTLLVARKSISITGVGADVDIGGLAINRTGFTNAALPFSYVSGGSFLFGFNHLGQLGVLPFAPAGAAATIDTNYCVTIVKQAGYGGIKVLGLNTPTGPGFELHSGALVFQVANSGLISSTSSTISTISDAGYKTDDGPLQYGLAEILQLRPISYRLTPVLGDAAPVEFGFIAQEVEPVVPELVGVMASGFPTPEGETPPPPIKTIRVAGLLPVAIKAIQELEARVKTLEGAPA